MPEFEDSIERTISRAERLDDPIAQFQLAQNWVDLFGDDGQTQKESAEWLAKAAESGYPPAMEELAREQLLEAFELRSERLAREAFTSARRLHNEYLDAALTEEAALFLSMPVSVLGLYIDGLNEEEA